MAMKKSIRLGVLSGALGLALIGGEHGRRLMILKRQTRSTRQESWIYLLKRTPAAINLSNLKPGDRIKKEFHFDNKGSLAINQVLMSLDYSQFIDGSSAKNGGKNTAEEFLSQFQVSVLTVEPKVEMVIRKTLF